MKFDTDMHEGYLMAILESIQVTFKYLLNIDDMKWIIKRLNQYVEEEIKHRDSKGLK